MKSAKAMSLEFGHHSFRSRKGPVSESSSADAADSLGELNERVIILCKDDICVDAPAAPILNWSAFEKGEIAIQLKDTDGLAEGKVTIKASTLQRIHPALLPFQLESEYLFPISLKTVVLQVHPDSRQNPEERADQTGTDFDTPIAQVAREDAGFFQLAKVADSIVTPISERAPAKQAAPGPVLTPADRPSSPMIRKRHSAESTDSRPPPRSSTMIPPPSQSACLETQSKQAERGRPKIEAVTENPRKRVGAERLREIFMTEDQLDAPQVASLVAAFPKVNSAMVMLADGTVLGGNVPDGYHLETALQVPAIMKSVQEFNRNLRSQEISAFTLLGDRPFTLFAEGNIYLLISHQGRGLLPGVRERIGEVARALDAVVS
jgi:hypothetical protein